MKDLTSQELFKKIFDAGERHNEYRFVQRDVDMEHVYLPDGANRWCESQGRRVLMFGMPGGDTLFIYDAVRTRGPQSFRSVPKNLYSFFTERTRKAKGFKSTNGLTAEELHEILQDRYDFIVLMTKTRTAFNMGRIKVTPNL